MGHMVRQKDLYNERGDPMRKSNFFKSFPFLIFSGFSLVFGLPSYGQQKKTSITMREIAPLIYSTGNAESDTVILFSQGGPQSALNMTDLGRISSITGTSKCLLVSVHQAQSLNPNLLKGEISALEAQRYNAESVEYLSKVARYYKQMDKKVFIVGISFGANLVQALISEKGIDVADRYLIVVGRLKIDKKLCDALDQGYWPSYRKGTELMIPETKRTDAIFLASARLMASLGRIPFMERMKNLDLSTLTYVYGKEDEALGCLSGEELDFLGSRGAAVISGPGGHADTMLSRTGHGIAQAFGIRR